MTYSSQPIASHFKAMANDEAFKCPDIYIFDASVTRDFNEVFLFGKTYKSIQEAIEDVNWSKSHYYKYKELVASGMSFDSPEQLKEYTYKLRNDKISQTRKERGYHYNQYTK